MKSNMTEIKFPSSKPLDEFKIVMTDRMIVTYKGANMTKHDREKMKYKKAEEAYLKFNESIQII